jgi:hypothetical protein
MLGRKRFDQNRLLGMIELLFEFVAINLSDHVSSHGTQWHFLTYSFFDILGMQSRSKEMSGLTDEIARRL